MPLSPSNGLPRPFAEVVKGTLISRVTSIQAAVEEALVILLLKTTNRFRVSLKKLFVTAVSN